MLKTKQVILMTAIFILFLPVFVLAAGTVDLPKTGQTTCYDWYGAVIACSGTGQDGDVQAGVAWPSPRFTVNGDCVTDNLTGLMWVRSPDSVSRIWQQALDYANSLSLCGYTDWRLPNRKELHSLTDFSRSNPALPSGHPFLNVQSDFYYWSSTSGPSSDACIVDMMDGGMSSGGKSNGSYYVWPVLSGQFCPHTSVIPTFALPTDYTAYSVQIEPLPDFDIRLQNQGAAMLPSENQNQRITTLKSQVGEMM
ncbi:MAG: DUF1566 domain-containing protein [Nitrospirae bacterium]|nr:DUF1566 domain-containing protein [Nitrospirota bacterium]